MTENTCSIWAAAFYMKCRPPILQRDQSSSHSLWRVAPIRDLVLPIWADVSEYGGRGGWLSAFPRRFRAQQRLAPFRSMGAVPEVPFVGCTIACGRKCCPERLQLSGCSYVWRQSAEWFEGVSFLCHSRAISFAKRRSTARRSELLRGVAIMSHFHFKT